MEYTLRNTGRPPDLATVERVLRALDPAVVVDLVDGARMLRISSCATPGEIIDYLRSAGIEASSAALLQLPSVCCGGCSG